MTQNQIVTLNNREPVISILLLLSNHSAYPRFIHAYLNSDSVREILGIDPSFGQWNSHSAELTVRQFSHGDILHETQVYISELLARGIRVGRFISTGFSSLLTPFQIHIYAGTYDFLANWIGNERWTVAMDWPNHAAFANVPLQAWMVEGKVAGKARTFANLTFATINGAGHLVSVVRSLRPTVRVLTNPALPQAPHDKPLEALTMLQRWLSNKDI